MKSNAAATAKKEETSKDDTLPDDTSKSNNVKIYKIVTNICYRFEQFDIRKR